MSRLLLDTTFLIDSERSGDELDEFLGDEDDVAIAAVTLAEIRVGALLARGRRRATRSAFVDDVAATLSIVDYDVDVAEAHALLLTEVRRQGRPRGAHDLIIAATAKATGRTLVSSDSVAFADLRDLNVRSHR